MLPSSRPVKDAGLSNCIFESFDFEMKEDSGNTGSNPVGSTFLLG